MSISHHSGPATSSNEDGIKLKLIVVVGVVSVAIFALSALIAYLIVRVDTERLQATHGVAKAPADLNKGEIGIVDRVHFDADRRLEQWQAAKKKRLASYGWVDREKSLIHIPVEMGMKEVITQAAANPAPERAKAP